VSSVKDIFRELRVEFLTGSVLPVLVATAAAQYETGRWSPGIFALTLAGVICLHLGANTANDYFDHLSGNDIANVDFVRPFTGGSRMIQEGRLGATVVLAISMILFSGGLACGVILTVLRGPVVLILGAVGLACGYFYTGPPLKLAHRGLGEAAIFTSFGLIGVGSYYVQTEAVTGHCVLISLPLAFLITAIIVINEFQDSAADSSVGKKTLVVRMGTSRAVILFAALTAAAYLSIIAAVAGAVAPPLVLAALLALPAGVRSVVTASRFHHRPEKLAPANGAAIINHLLTGIILTAAYLIAG